MTPRCHNRPAFAEGDWIRSGWPIGGKPHYRWHPHRMSTGCASILPIGDGPSLAERSGWNCAGCRWAGGAE